MIKIADEKELLTAVESIPLFPLPGMVFIPYTILPLHVFEPRYRGLVDDAMQANRYLAVPRLQPGWENNYEASPAVFQVAGFGKILRYDPLPDGRAENRGDQSYSTSDRFQANRPHQNRALRTNRATHR